MSTRPTVASSSSAAPSTAVTGGATIDADSLLASTLLRIRTDSLVKSNQQHPPHHHQTSSVPPPVAQQVAPTRVSPIISLAPRSTNTTTANTAQAAMTPSSGGATGQPPNMQLPTLNAAAGANRNSAAARMGRTGVSMAPMAGMFGGMNNSHHGPAGITLEQINALQMLAANRAASLAAMAGASSSSPLRHHNANNFAAAPSPSLHQFNRFQQQASSPPTSSSPQGQQVLLALAPSSRTPSVRQQLAAEVALHMSESHDEAEERSAAAAAAAAAAAIVRKEQVEAALRSKPQRGRKREELSELERMELTRTRNREHARSTRIRKKARYQELLDCEQQLEDVLKQETVQHKRRRAVLEFLALRTSMLLSVLASSSSSKTADSSKLLNDLVEDPGQFCFRFNEFHPSSTSKGNVHRSTSSAAALSSCVEHMKNFDNQLVSRVVGIFGKAVLPFVCYSIKGSGGSSSSSKNNGESSIALDLDHGGFANVDVSLVRPSGGNQISEERILLMTGVMQFEFSDSDKKSDKIRSVVWSTMRDFLNDLSDGLVSHPSVVSLDPAMSLIQESASSVSGSSEVAIPSPQEKQVEEGRGGGPGMNI